jgi:acyl carrier protein
MLQSTPPTASLTRAAALWRGTLVSTESADASTPPRRAGDIADAVRQVLATYVARPIDEVRLDTQLELDLELDSFAMIEITIALETELGFSMEDVADPQDLGLVTVGDVVAYVSRRLGAARGETKP